MQASNETKNSKQQRSSSVNRKRNWFLIGCLIEGAMAIAAALLAVFWNQPLFKALQWSPSDLFAGVIAAVPPLALFGWMLNSPSPFLSRLRQVLDESIRPLFQDWSLLQMATISIIAGFSEELLFRGTLHFKFADSLGPVWAAMITNILFGSCHLMTLQYGIATALAGLYFSALLWVTGNLLVPMTAHAAYDFFALAYFLKLHDCRQH
jgi:uncharacterized protein